MSRIVHVVISANYLEGYGYQENILPKKHSDLGHEVLIITQHELLGRKAPYVYANKDGVRVKVLRERNQRIRNARFWGSLIGVWMKHSDGLFEALEEAYPDIVFIHNVPAIDHLQVVSYKRIHPEIKVFVDNHEDYYNSPLHGGNKFGKLTAGRFVARRLSHVAEQFWGVTPWRVQYLKEVYNIPTDKVGLLVMGGDEVLVPWANKTSIREALRLRYGIPLDSFLIVTGGKINIAKNVHLLVDAVRQLDNVYLIIFGRYEEDMRCMRSSFDCSRIIDVGWIPSDESYQFFMAADLGCFPGTHSVLWEQACASGLPCVFKDWDGAFNHVEVGGNCIFIKDPDVSKLKHTIAILANKGEQYRHMEYVANNQARLHFSYIEIAKRAIMSNN